MCFSKDRQVTAHTPGRKKIYVVDDEQVIARTLCLILEMVGYEVSMFFSAESALEAIQQSAPDLVLSDVVMTGQMSGMDLAEILAQTHPLTKVMLISGQGIPSDRLQGARSRGVCPEVRLKPISPPVLLAAIKDLLTSQDRKSARGPAPVGFHASTVNMRLSAGRTILSELQSGWAFCQG